MDLVRRCTLATYDWTLIRHATPDDLTEYRQDLLTSPSYVRHTTNADAHDWVRNGKGNVLTSNTDPSGEPAVLVMVGVIVDNLFFADAQCGWREPSQITPGFENAKGSFILAKAHGTPFGADFTSAVQGIQALEQKAFTAGWKHRSIRQAPSVTSPEGVIKFRHELFSVSTPLSSILTST